jgi:hypothetical protein
MLLSSVAENVKIEELKATRKALFEAFEENPHELRLAIEIRAMDDRIAEMRERMQATEATLRYSRTSRAVA